MHACLARVNTAFPSPSPPVLSEIVFELFEESFRNFYTQAAHKACKSIRFAFVLPFSESTDVNVSIQPGEKGCAEGQIVPIFDQR